MKSMAFEELNAADRNQGASPAVEARLREEVRRLAVARRPRPMVALAIAASLILLVAASIVLVRQLGAGTSPSETSIADAGAGETLTDFVPLGYHAVPTESTHIVRLEVSRKVLASFGLLAMDAPDPSESGTFLADVIIGDDGIARAVRFVRPVSH
jgi:hypothetical protein